MGPNPEWWVGWWGEEIDLQRVGSEVIGERMVLFLEMNLMTPSKCEC